MNLDCFPRNSRGSDLPEVSLRDVIRFFFRFRFRNDANYRFSIRRAEVNPIGGVDKFKSIRYVDFGAR